MDHDIDQPPATIKEVGIHIGYMRKDISDLKNLIKELPNGFATKDEVIDIDKRVTKLEERQTLKNTLLWVGLVASAIINILVIYQLFTGRK